jgi:hypothetical protein
MKKPSERRPGRFDDFIDRWLLPIAAIAFVLIGLAFLIHIVFWVA